MDEREQIAWLYRRVGFGLAPGQLDELEALGVATVLGRLIDPDAARLPDPPDPWEDLDLVTADAGPGREAFRGIVRPWLGEMATTTRPLHEWLRWFWHGHFVSTFAGVRRPSLMVQQLRMFRQSGVGDFRSLLRSVTVDPAMLLYLDGVKNRARGVNENYARELMELFALGIGNYEEADVKAGAVALTGWAVNETSGVSELVPNRHNDTPQRFLGRDGVHDVDTVIDAVVAQDACAPFVTGKLSRAILGPTVDDGLVRRLADGFRNDGLRILPLVQSILEAGLDGASTPLVVAPVPWFARSIRATGTTIDGLFARSAPWLSASGQMPLAAPNVGGWPGGRNWLSTSSTVARFNLAALVAEATPKAAVARRRAAAGPAVELADALGYPMGLSAASVAAIDQARTDSDVSALTVALACPDLVLA